MALHPSAHVLLQFSSGKSAPAGARIVYIDGAFDLFHVGHVEILKASCGCWSDLTCAPCGAAVLLFILSGLGCVMRADP